MHWSALVVSVSLGVFRSAVRSFRTWRNACCSSAALARIVRSIFWAYISNAGWEGAMEVGVSCSRIKLVGYIQFVKVAAFRNFP
jgi:hypothetical protein